MRCALGVSLETECLCEGHERLECSCDIKFSVATLGMSSSDTEQLVVLLAHSPQLGEEPE